MGRGSSRAWGGGGCGEERERDRGGGAEVYIVFGKIQGASRAQRAARCEAGAAQTTPSELHSGLVFRISFFSNSRFRISFIIVRNSSCPESTGLWRSRPVLDFHADRDLHYNYPCSLTQWNEIF
jgi:hypothetical protein